MPEIGISVLLAGIDQAAKLGIVSAMRLGQSIPLLPGVFHITYIENPGAAFGLFAHQRAFFIAVGLLMLAAGAAFYRRLLREGPLVRFGAALFFGGAAGNLIDRIRLGRVVDFLDFRVWPVFNIADIGICAGVACILYALLREGDGAGEERG